MSIAARVAVVGAGISGVSVAGFFLLQLSGRPLWKTVAGGGREYVKKLAASLTDVRYGCPVEAVSRRSDGVSVRFHGGRTESFAHVVFACHSDQTLSLLDDATPAEQNVLSRIKYQSNRAILHTDAALLPRNRETWSAWNYVATGDGSGSHPVSVSYLINKLQPLPFKQPVIVSLNPHREPRLQHAIRSFDYAHPMFDGPAIEAQRGLGAIQGKRHTWYCGAWTGYGFHEDGLVSALEVANAMGIRAPWQAAELAA